MNSDISIQIQNISNNQNKLSSESEQFVTTQLRELYGGKERKEYVEEHLEPIYELMRKKFKNLYSNQEPTFFIRVPYVQVLLGDSITHLFEEKLLTTLEKDLIICGLPIDESKLEIEVFDFYSLKANYDLNLAEVPEAGLEHYKLMFAAYLAGISNSKPKVQKGCKLLLNFNISNYSDEECLVSTFVSTFLASVYIHNGLKFYTKHTLYELCITELNKLSNYNYYSAMIYFQFFLKRNSIGIQIGNNYSQLIINPEENILLADSMSSKPPLIYSNLHFWNKRKVEVRLALCLILKRYKSILSHYFNLYRKFFRQRSIRPEHKSKSIFCIF
jgi:hypothetical protein